MATQLSVPVSHRRTVRSLDVEASLELSAENVTECRAAEWPVSVAMWLPILLPQSRIVLSPDADASLDLSAENATEFTAPVWPSMVLM